MMIKKNIVALGAASLCMLAAAPAFAGGSLKDAPVEEKPRFTYSFNVGVTTDYIFRGYSQHHNNPALQGGIDLSYALTPAVSAYFGVWGSAVDFGTNGDGSRLAGAEVDIYGGIKPTWGPATFDLGVIYYTYPGARDGEIPGGQAWEQNYVEFKAGVSGAFIPSLDKLTTGATVFYSPSYQGGQGEVVTIEGTAAYELPKVWVFTPTISGTVGAQFGSGASSFFGPAGIFNGGSGEGFALGNGENELMYWNAGITLAVEKLTFDFRYWGTDVKNFNAAGAGAANGWCDGSGGNAAGRGILECGDKFVFTGKFTY